MKVAIVTDAWHPQVNGVVNTLVHTVRCLRRRGHFVQMIVPGQFKTVPCPTYPEIRLAVDLWSVGDHLERQRPDAVHITTEGPLGFAARWWCLSRRFPFTTAYMTRFPEYMAMRFALPPKFLTNCLRMFHAPSSGVMVSTQSLRDELVREGFRNVKPWSRGVNTALFVPGGPDPLGAKRPRFLYVGRAAVEKNIEAFLRLDLPGSKIVTGDGPNLDGLRASFPDAIFTGVKQGRELAAIYASSDVFVFPSRTDTFGVVMLEAAACGLPVAAFPVQGPLDVVRHGVTGVLDRDLRKACMEALAIDRTMCRRHALTFSWDACTGQFLDNLALADATSVAS